MGNNKFNVSEENVVLFDVLTHSEFREELYNVLSNYHTTNNFNVVLGVRPWNNKSWAIQYGLTFHVECDYSEDLYDDLKCMLQWSYGTYFPLRILANKSDTINELLEDEPEPVVDNLLYSSSDTFIIKY